MNRMILIACCLAAACGGKKDDKPKPSADPVAADKARPDPSPPVAPAAAVRPAYSTDVAKRQLASLAKCSSEYSCDGFDALVGFGAAAGPDLVAFATDAAKPIEQRRLAAKAIGKIKLPDAGVELAEQGNTIEDSLAAEDFYEAAGACGGDATFDLLAATYAKQNHGDDKQHLIPIRRGLRAFPAKAMAWATAALPKADKDPTKYADVMVDVATPADKDALATLALGEKDHMAADRLASKAIELGATDGKLFDVLIASLSSDNQYDRSDAGDFLAPVAAKVPADKKAKIIELVGKALAGPKDPMLDGGLEKTLKSLGG